MSNPYQTFFDKLGRRIAEMVHPSEKAMCEPMSDMKGDW